MKYRKRTIPAIAFMLALALILGGCAIGVADFNSSSDDTSSPGSNESSNYIPPLTDYENLPGPYADPITFDSFEEIKELNSMITADDETLAAYLKESNPGPVWLKSREDIIALFDEFGIYETIFISEDTGYKLTSVTFDTYRANIYYTYEKEGVAEIRISYCGKWPTYPVEDQRKRYMSMAYWHTNDEFVTTVKAGSYELDMYDLKNSAGTLTIAGCAESSYIYTAVEYIGKDADSNSMDDSWTTSLTTGSFNEMCGYEPSETYEYELLHTMESLHYIPQFRDAINREDFTDFEEYRLQVYTDVVGGEGTFTKVGLTHLLANVGDLDFMLIENYKFEKLTANAYDPMITVEYHLETKNLNITSYSKTAHPEIGESNEFDERSPEHTFMIGNHSAEMYSVEAAEGIAFKSNVIETDTAYIIIEFSDKNSENSFDDSWCSAAVLTTMNTVDVDQFPH